MASKFRLLCIVFRTVVARWRTRVGGPVRSDGLTRSAWQYAHVTLAWRRPKAFASGAPIDLTSGPTAIRGVLEPRLYVAYSPF